MAIVPKTTTVDTATAVLYGCGLITDSAPRTAAAPQMALPVAVSRDMSLSILRSFPADTPTSSVSTTTIRSMTTASAPTAITLWKVSLNPYSIMPMRRICFEQNFIPGTHVSGRLFLREFAYSIPNTIPTIRGLNDSFFMNSKSAI